MQPFSRHAAVHVLVNLKSWGLRYDRKKGLVGGDLAGSKMVIPASARLSLERTGDLFELKCVSLDPANSSG